MAGEVKPAEEFRSSEQNTLVQLEDLRVSASPRDVERLGPHSSGRSAEMLNRSSVEDNKSRERDREDLMDAR